MIVEMRKFNLVAMNCEKDAILNALQRTGAVEVKTHSPLEDTSAPAVCGDELRARLSSAENALAVLSGIAEQYKKKYKTGTEGQKDGFEVGYQEFMSAGEKREEAEELISAINALTDEKNERKAELARVGRVTETARPYASLDLPFSAFCATAHTVSKLGTVPAAAADGLKKALTEVSLSAYDCYAAGDVAVFCVSCHKTALGETESALQSAGFVPCPFTSDETGAEFFAEKEAEQTHLHAALKENEATMYALAPRMRFLKVYCDYLLYELEKAELAEKLRETERTFLLEAYVPKGAEELVREELSAVSAAIYYEFSEVPEGEMPPTLTKNVPLVSNFEAITNMYSPPNARELDPNAVMAFFYSLFLGFIMADIGYGLLMILGGGFLYFKNRGRESGLKRLSGVFAIGGIFTVLWGYLFNSLFGIPVLPFTVMPNAREGMWTFVGIKIPSVLVIALEIGVLQLFAGYVCRAIQAWRRKLVWDGILDGVVWALFSVGVGLAIAGLVEEANVSILAVVGGITAGATLVIAMFTAGRKEKFIGKFTKGFGAAYGVINYASDILSYARLYGLMLSGAVIAEIISQYALVGTPNGDTVGMIVSGNAGLTILGVVLMVVGHLFNLALSLLGAYIHDARLQYVEFYGRFYEGEGELFAPLGSRHKYVYLAPYKHNTAAETAATPAKIKS